MTTQNQTIYTWTLCATSWTDAEEALAEIENLSKHEGATGNARNAIRVSIRPDIFKPDPDRVIERVRFPFESVYPDLLTDKSLAELMAKYIVFRDYPSIMKNGLFTKNWGLNEFYSQKIGG